MESSAFDEQVFHWIPVPGDEGASQKVINPAGDVIFTSGRLDHPYRKGDEVAFLLKSTEAAFTTGFVLHPDKYCKGHYVIQTYNLEARGAGRTNLTERVARKWVKSVIYSRHTVALKPTGAYRYTVRSLRAISRLDRLLASDYKLKKANRRKRYPTLIA